MRTETAALAALLLAAAPLAAQQRDALPPPRSFAGISVGAAQPSGTFGDSVDTGFGLDVNYLYRVDDDGRLGIRIDGGFVAYGNEERRVMLSPTVGGRITADLNTANSIGYLTAGPQLVVPGRTVRPYVNAAAGFAYFSTTSSLRDDRGESYLSDTNHDDWAFTYGGGAGVYVPLSRGRTPVLLDLGVRYRHTGEVGYLREGSIRDLPNGDIAFDPIVSDTDLFTLSLGIEVGLRKGDGDDERRGRRGRRGRR